MTWEIRRHEWRGETVSLDIVENGALVASVTIRGDIAVAEERAALISAAEELFHCVDGFIDAWGEAVEFEEPMNGADVVEWVAGAMPEFKAAIAKAKGEKS